MNNKDKKKSILKSGKGIKRISISDKLISGAIYLSFVTVICFILLVVIMLVM